MSTLKKSYDVAIVGGGIVGMTTALLLAKQTDLSIVVLDNQPKPVTWNSASIEGRVSAITSVSVRLFSFLNVWEAMEKLRVSAYARMVVWDTHGTGEIQFSQEEVGAKQLGYIVENAVIQQVLQEAVKNTPTIDFLYPVTLQALTPTGTGYSLSLAEGDDILTSLVLGADGAHSWVRKQANIPLTIKNYHHTAIIATVKTVAPHQHTAWQCFAETGPLAFLPLWDTHLCSIVWSQVPERAQQLLALSAESFGHAITGALESRLGIVKLCSDPVSFPLLMRQAKTYVKPHLALLGDAAHTIHPLAGQGLNLGLLDAAALVEVLVKARDACKNFAAYDALRPFERWRKTHNKEMAWAMGAFKQLFAQKAPWVIGLRNWGLRFVHQQPAIKRRLIKTAMGLRGELPEIIQMERE